MTTKFGLNPWANDFAIVTMDGDFHQLRLLNGSPPKVVWLRVGNA